MDQTHLTGIPFATLGLDPRLLQGLHAAGFEYCTPIQAETLPLLLAGQDVAGQAQTGTGKTAAFVLAACERLLRRAGRAERPPRAIVIAPTRELAIQIHQDAVTLGRQTGIRMGLVYGGIDYEKQRDMLLAGVDLLVGTPGRLIDYFKQRALDLYAIEVAVIDEADRMFDLGFIRDLRYLLRHMPKPEKRLSMLFSATLSCRVHELAYEHMNNPQMVSIEPDKVTVDKVSQRLYHVESREKLSVLWNLLRALPEPRTLIFLNTKRAAEYITERLSRTGLEAGLVSGDVPQRIREQLISRFGKGDLPFLVATDVAARGLHIPDVTHVFNYDLPQNAEDYVHRIGRTARAGASGQAISLACEEFVYSLAEIEAYIGRKIPVLPVTEDLLVPPPTPAGARPSRRRPRHRRAA
ncbi:MAG: DEAD/DEAH box helicase [Beggiatoa sp.]|nr:DEAD/DEAH box helicase [Beggiatoa sp.]